MRDRYYDRKKKVPVVCLAGARSLLRPEKKSSSRLSGGCGIIITTGKKKIQLSVWRVRNLYYDRKKKKIQSSVWRVRDHYYDRKKKDTVVYLVGARSKNNDRKKKDTVIWMCTYVGNNGVGNGHFFFLDVEHTTINIPQMTWHRITHRKPSEEYSISSDVESGFLQDMKPGPQGVRSLAKLGSPCQDMKLGPQGV